ncbi:hypothetical protein E2320_011680, partial [Naja naja]
VLGENEKPWKAVLVALTEKDLLIFESMPRIKEAWLVHSGPGKGSPQSGVDLSFATRTGTQQGIESHLFRSETSRDLTLWTRSLVQGCHNAAELSAEVTTACTYKNQECHLTIHYDHGFSLTTEPQVGAFPKTIFRYPYEKLKSSSDDGIRMLYLEFGGKEATGPSFLSKADRVHHSFIPFCQDYKTWIGSINSVCHWQEQKKARKSGTTRVQLSNMLSTLGATRRTSELFCRSSSNMGQSQMF